MRSDDGRVPARGLPARSPADARAELVRLLQRYVVEAVRLGRAFAERHDLHPTDWAALLAVVQGDRVGSAADAR